MAFWQNKKIHIENIGLWKINKKLFVFVDCIFYININKNSSQAKYIQ